MSRYDINLRKWVLTLAPTFHRRPVLMALAFSTIAPLRYIHVKFMAMRAANLYRLEHNGQVCHLRAVVNDLFDAGHRRITITDFENNPVEGKKVFLREVEPKTIIHGREKMTPLTINRRGFVGVSGCDFVVNVPRELKESINEQRLKAVVNMYKLVSKRYTINWV